MMQTLLSYFLQTPPAWTLLIARLTLAVVFFAHGSQKVFGWFGGPGFSGAIDYFAKLHIPAFFAVLAIAAEFLGSLGLFVGLGTRLAALGLAVNMAVAVITVHAANGFFMNWHNEQPGEGIEYHLLVGGLCLILMLAGGGTFSLDRLLASHLVMNAAEASAPAFAVPRT